MGLLTLPQELRDHILSYILIKPQNTITMLSNAHCFRSEVAASQPTVSMVNKQLRDETLPIFYSSNLFLTELSDSTDLTTAKNWLAAVGDANVRHLRHLVLSGWTRVEVGPQKLQYRYIRMVFDLRDGALKLESDFRVDTPSPSVAWNIEALQNSFRKMVAAKDGKRCTAREVEQLMEEFHSSCVSY